VSYKDAYADRWKAIAPEREAEKRIAQVQKRLDKAQKRIDQALANNRAMVKCFTPRCGDRVEIEGIRCGRCAENIESWKEKP